MNKDLNSGTYSGTEVVHLTRRSCIYGWSETVPCMKQIVDIQE